MIIGIDIRVLAGRQKNGISQYTEKLLEYLLPLDPTIQYKLFYSSWETEPLKGSWLGLNNVELYKFPYPNRLLFSGARLFNRPKIDQLIGGCDIFFSPHFLLAPLSRSVRRVTTFHDLSFERFPEFFSWRRRLWHWEMQPAWQARFSDRIISVSESTKKDLVDLYKINSNKIEVIYSGVQMSRPPLEDLNRFKAEKNLPDQFILSLGTLEPRKNTAGLVRAFELLKQDAEFDKLHLVIAGSHGWLDKELFRTIEQSSVKSFIKIIQSIEDRERPFYYSLASVFAYPSFFEGFGFPPLEAMACGTAVVGSDVTSVPEIVGGAGLLVNPYHISELAQALKKILIEPQLKEFLVKSGLIRSQQFTWRQTAHKTLEILTRD